MRIKTLVFSAVLAITALSFSQSAFAYYCNTYCNPYTNTCTTNCW